MNENLKAILKAVETDEELMGRISALVEEWIDADDEARPEVVERLIALANDEGFALTEDDLIVEGSEEGEVVDEELAVVSGGGGCSLPQQVFNQCALTHMKSYPMV